MIPLGYWISIYQLKDTFKWIKHLYKLYYLFCISFFISEAVILVDLFVNHLNILDLNLDTLIDLVFGFGMMVTFSYAFLSLAILAYKGKSFSLENIKPKNLF
jgi:hypothetical protein